MNTCAPTASFGTFEQFFSAAPAGFGLPGMGQGALLMQPLMKGMARWQLELFNYNCRRARAMLELPAALARCHTPAAAFAEHSRFVQAAMQHTAESAQRLGSLWVETASAVVAPRRSKTERDYIRLPDDDAGGPSGTGRANPKGTSPRERHAA